MRQFGIALGCAVVWVIAAFLVAYPRHVYSFDFLGLSSDFISDSSLSLVFLPLLITIDIMISMFVGHYRTSQGRFITIIIVSILYIVFAISPAVIDKLSSNTTLGIFSVLVLCLLAIRTVSFYSEDTTNSINFVAIS